MSSNEFDDSLNLENRDLEEQDPSRTGPTYPMSASSGETDDGDALGSDPLPSGSGFDSPSGSRTQTG